MYLWLKLYLGLNVEPKIQTLNEVFSKVLSILEFEDIFRLVAESFLPFFVMIFHLPILCWLLIHLIPRLKFIYSEKATKFCEISTIEL